MAQRITMTGIEPLGSTHPVPHVGARRPRMAPGEFSIGAVLWAGLAFYSISQGYADDRAPLVILGASGLAAMVVGVVWPIVVLRRIAVAVLGPNDATVGGVIRFRVSLSGRGSNLAVRWLDPVGEWMYADAPCIGEVPVIAARRGVIRNVHLEVKCGGPMNVFVRHRHASIPLGSPVFIAPRALHFAVEGQTEAADGGVAGEATARAAESVRSTRPYVAGDAPRIVHWASTARTGDIVVREFDPPGQRGVAIVVDLRGGSDPDVEAAASRASGAARELLQNGTACLLITCGSDPIEVHDNRMIDRALANALIGEPGPVPPGWHAVVIHP